MRDALGPDADRVAFVDNASTYTRPARAVAAYYGAFLGVIVSALALMLIVSRPEQARRAIGPLCVAAILSAALTLPYALPYLAATRELGPRPEGDVLTFSAAWSSFLAAPHQNWLWGWTAWSFAGNERHLFPGVVAVLLALVSLAWRPRRMVWIYLALTVLAVELSIGLNGSLYRWLYDHVFVFRGFRAPARFAILACCAMSVLAGFGFLFLEQRLLAGRPSRRLLLVAALIAIGVESGSSPLVLANQSTVVPPLYRFLQRTEPSVMIEFPMGVYNPTYMYWSTHHWYWLVNGYSGYHPEDTIETETLMAAFPDDESMERLQALNVRYILIHQAFYQRADYAHLINEIALRPELIAAGRYRDWVQGDTQIFEVKREKPERRR